MEEGVVLKIEDNLKGLEGVDRVTSTSSENSGRINIEVLKGFDVNQKLHFLSFHKTLKSNNSCYL